MSGQADSAEGESRPAQAEDRTVGRLPRPSRSERARGYFVHLVTVSGIFPAFAAIAEIASADCDPRKVFAWLIVTTLIDAIDGPLARRFHVKRTAPGIDGRTIDDLLDYLTFVFIPLALVWRMEWLPSGTGWTVSFAMAASLLGFANIRAKEEDAGFFRGFPSYWNIFAFYAGLSHWHLGPWPAALLMWLLCIATVAPIRMIYPNLAPQPWKPWVLGGAAVWAVILAAMLPRFPDNPLWLLIVSLIYPAFYVVLSVMLDVRDRRRTRMR